MKKTKDRLLSLLLALTMVLGLLPGTVLAAGAAGIAVSVTVYDRGVFAEDASGAPMMGKTVAVTDRNADGLYSLHEALAAAHEQYAPNGEADYAGENGDYGFSVTRLWGVDTGAVGFYRNDTITGSVGDEILDSGDRVTAFIYKDQDAWSDRYAYFTKERLTAAVGQEIQLDLMCWGYDESWNPVVKPVDKAPIGVYDGDGAYSVPDSLRGEHLFGDTYMQTVATDLQGAVKLSFTQAGTYTVTAQHDAPVYSEYTDSVTTVPNYLVPPVCTVTVLTPEAYEAYKEGRRYLDGAADALTWASIKGDNTYSYAVVSDLAIPSSLTVDGREVSLSWTCDDTSGALTVSNYYGPWGAYVDRPAAKDVSCALTATLSYGGETAVKTFPLTVKAEGVSGDKESVVTYGELMTAIASSYAVSTDAWVVMDIAAYDGSDCKGADYGDSAPAAAALAAAARKEPDASALSRVDVSGGYAIYTIPYLSLAYQASGTEGADGHSSAALKAAMVDYLAGIPTNSAGVDEVAPVLAALAPYYGQEENLDRAVDAAVAWLARQQCGDGTFAYYGTGNANSTALAVVALSALGIDAHTDPRFVKNYKSAMDGLFSFALADHSGFGYKGNVTKNVLATEQGFRALVAYARFRAGGRAYNIYLQAKDSVDAVAAPDITAAVKPSGGGSSPSTVKVSVSVMVPPEGGADGQYTYAHDADQYTNLLGGSRSVTVDAGTTALQVTKSVLDEADVSYRVSGGYFTQIGALAELDHGPRSGWKYTVDGAAPGESSADYSFDTNARLIWYYTDDYSREKDDAAPPNEKPAPGAVVQARGDGAYTVTLPKGSGGPVVAEIPGVSGGQVVVIVRRDGTEEVVKKSLVQDGKAYVLLEEGATVRVAPCAARFDDVARDAWYAAAVDFAVSRGLFSGVGGERFAPDLPLDRGMLVTVLYALEDGKPGKRETAFSDVSGSAWYAPGAAWAAENGIAAGYADGRFGPGDRITREQLAVMLYGYAGHLGMDTGGRAGLAGFADGGAVSGWALDAVAWAVDAGILSGRAGGTLDPAGAATRAEAAAMVRRFVACLLQVEG